MAGHDLVIPESRLLVPAPDEELWPTLGPEVCDFIEDLLCHGPGDILGEDVSLTDEVRGFFYRAYEVFPRDHPRAGRRRFKREVFSRRKGVGKTEIAMWMAIVEMDPSGPVRCDGWRKEDGVWVPIGRPVRDPYIPMVAVTEEQTSDLAYGGVLEILENCDLGNDYDLTKDQVTHRTAPGKIKPLASAPNSRDGALTTFQHFDETHLLKARLKEAHETMLRNIPKRRAADAHSLETTTMFEPGEGSVAEESHEHALQVFKGRTKDKTLLYDHRQASLHHKISTERGLRAALKQASGDAWSFTDVDTIIAQEFRRTGVKESKARRYWLNQPWRSEERWLDKELFASRRKRRVVAPGTPIVMAFDGSLNRDSTALVGCTLDDRPHLFVIGKWERSADEPEGWRVSHTDVDERVAWAFRHYEVVEFAPDPPHWHIEVEQWEERYGSPPVVRFETWQPARMGPACDDFYQATADGGFTHDGDEALVRHVGNCVEKVRGGHTVITKVDPKSPLKIDIAVAAVVAFHRAKHYREQPPAASFAIVLG